MYILNQFLCEHCDFASERKVGHDSTKLAEVRADRRPALRFSRKRCGFIRASPLAKKKASLIKYETVPNQRRF